MSNNLTCPEIVKETVSELRAKAIFPTLDQLAMLMELGRRIQEPSLRTCPYLEGEAIRAGDEGPLLRPLTIAGEYWFDQVCSVTESDHYRGIAFCYASENGRKPGAFDGLDTPKNIIAELKRYAKGIKCTRAELEAAASRIIGDTNPGDTARAKRNPDESGDLGDMIAQLEAYTGQPRDYWMKHSQRYAFRVLCHAMKAQAAAMAGPADNQPDEGYLAANFDYLAAVEQIEAEHAEG